MILFFKQKTAYEMRISDWSSDVCFSDLNIAVTAAPHLSRRCFNNLLSAGAHCRRERARAAHQREHRGCADASQNCSPLRVYLHPLLLPLVAGRMRSEEHTSELQSLMRISYAVFCLKKKRSQSKHTTT